MNVMNVIDWITIVTFGIATFVVIIPLVILFFVCVFAPDSCFSKLE